MHFDQFGPTDGDDIPTVAYQLADHLDAALAAAEDLAEAGQQWVPATAREGYALAAEMAGERQVIERVRMFEAVLIGRVLKARKRAQALVREAGDFAGMTRLFVGGTAALVDAVEELGDSTRGDFDTADCHIAYLRSRGVIDQEAADLPEARMISLGDGTFLVAGRIALAPLTELIIAFLDALDAHYDLYPDDESGGDEAMAWADMVAAAHSVQTGPAPETAHQVQMAADAIDEAGPAEIGTAPTSSSADTSEPAEIRTAAAKPVLPAKPRSLIERLVSTPQPAE
jgi:hypothetical protein